MTTSSSILSTLRDFVFRLGQLCFFFAGTSLDDAHAHSNGRMYPIIEITDAMLSKIELDGVIHEWEELGEPSMTFARDFRTFGHWKKPDPSDLDFRIWLGWHDATNRIYLAYVGTDNVYHNNYEFVENRLTFGMGVHDSISLLIDGDHSGEPGVPFNEEDPDLWDEAMGRSQRYDAIATTIRGPKLDEISIKASIDWTIPWFVLPPYGDAAGSVIGENPTLVTIEMYTSPHDSWENGPDSFPDQVAFSELSPGKIIGFAIEVTDRDGFDWGLGGVWVPAEMASDEPDPEVAMAYYWENILLDGLLVPAGHPDTGVGKDSWARIKATFR